MVETAAAPTRAAVILPWERPDRQDASRAAEARLAEAVGLAASIGLVVVHTAVPPLRARQPSTLTTFRPPIGAPLPGAEVSLAVIRSLASVSAATCSGDSLPSTAFCSRVAASSMRAYAGSPWRSVSSR